MISSRQTTANAERRPGSLLLRWLPALLLATYFTVVAVVTVPASYEPLHVALLAAIYLLFAALLAAGADLLGSFGRWGGWAGAAAVTLVATWHFREQTYLPSSLAVTALVGIALAPLWLAGQRRLAAQSRRRAPLARLTWLVALAVAFAAVFGAVYFRLPVMRWHLLRDNTLLGTPAYHLLATPVPTLQRELYDRHRPDAGEAPPAAPAPAAGAAGPNVVFVLLDALRADALSAWGAEPAMMPELDRFAAGAWRLTDLLTNSSWTRPSVATLFTGLLQEEHGARAVYNSLPAGNLTLAEILAGRGYTTAAYVTNYAAVGEDTGFAQGFDYFLELERKPYARAEEVNRTLLRHLAGMPRDGGPLFLYLHYLDPHEPFLSGAAPARKTAGAHLPAYRAELAYLDRHLGELFAALQRELPGPTVWLITSDHGEEFFEHRQYSHGLSLYDEVLHVPAVVRTPWGGAGDVAAPLEQRDLFDLLVRVGAGEQVDVAAWAAARARPRRYSSIYFSGYHRGMLRPYLQQICMRSVRVGNEKVVWSAYGDVLELYDLAADPGELVNLAGRHPQRARQLARQLDDEVRFWTFGSDFLPDDEARAQLEALGYL